MVMAKRIRTEPTTGIKLGTIVRYGAVFNILWAIANLIFSHYLINGQHHTHVDPANDNDTKHHGVLGQLRKHRQSRKQGWPFFMRTKEGGKLPRTDALHFSELPKVDVSHGTFHFGPDSQSVHVSYDAASRTSPFPQLHDEDIDIEVEKQRCASYNFGFPTSPEPKRRRLFMGALIADDSFEVLSAVSTEAYNIFHTVAFVEGNNTISMKQSRNWTYWDNENDRPEAAKLQKLSQLYGPKTKVSVDFYTTTRTIKDGTGKYGILHETMQRDGITKRWKRNGMQPSDVGVISDSDETFTRDFLRALQICDIPNFRPGQNCFAPKIYSSSVMFEESPDCVTVQRRWHHPDSILGECVEDIGDRNLHPTALREWTNNGNTTSHGHRVNPSHLEAEVAKDMLSGSLYPLWSAEDIRTEVGGLQIIKNDTHQSPTGFHFHNFFSVRDDIHKKFFTYGHSKTTAYVLPLWELSTDLENGVRCVKGLSGKGSGKWAIKNARYLPGTSQPIWYTYKKNFDRRHSWWKQIVKDEEEEYGAFSLSLATKKELEKQLMGDEGIEQIVKFLNQTEESSSKRQVPARISNWDSSKSAVLGLATKIPLNECRQFVGSLRATGYVGHIILGIAPDAPQNLLDYLKDQKVTLKFVEMADNCTYNGSIFRSNGRDKVLDTKNWHCPKAYPDYKITMARFPIYRDWLNECDTCTDGIILTDVRDVWWQRDPFETAAKLKMEHELMVFEEIYPALDNRNWLSEFPIKQCKKISLGDTPMLCSGSTMGSRNGILAYIDAMVAEFDIWIKDKYCRSDLIGDDQSIHNYLFYTGKLEGAVSIPYRTGPLHVVGWIANKMWRLAEEQAKRKNATTGAVNFYVENDRYEEWLPAQYKFIDPNTGLILNKDGNPSAQIHQMDRFGTLALRWRQQMNQLSWPYNRMAWQSFDNE